MQLLKQIYSVSQNLNFIVDLNWIVSKSIQEILEGLQRNENHERIS